MRMTPPLVLPAGAPDLVIAELDPARWSSPWDGFEVYPFWSDPATGLSIGLFRCAKGVGSQRHRHGCNQFMYGLAGEYFYPDTGVLIRPGTFYVNPRGNPHGPALARVDGTLVLEMYDGPSAPIPA